MQIIEMNGNYYSVSKSLSECLSDKSLSFTSKGIFSYIVNEPKNSIDTINNLLNLHSDNKKNIYSSLKELYSKKYFINLANRGCKICQL